MPGGPGSCAMNSVSRDVPEICRGYWTCGQIKLPFEIPSSELAGRETVTPSCRRNNFETIL